MAKVNVLKSVASNLSVLKVSVQSLTTKHNMLLPPFFGAFFNTEVKPHLTCGEISVLSLLTRVLVHRWDVREPSVYLVCKSPNCRSGAPAM